MFYARGTLTPLVSTDRPGPPALDPALIFKFPLVQVFAFFVAFLHLQVSAFLLHFLWLHANWNYAGSMCASAGCLISCFVFVVHIFFWKIPCVQNNKLTGEPNSFIELNPGHSGTRTAFTKGLGARNQWRRTSWDVTKRLPFLTKCQFPSLFGLVFAWCSCVKSEKKTFTDRLRCPCELHLCRSSSFYILTLFVHVSAEWGSANPRQSKQQCLRIYFGQFLPIQEDKHCPVAFSTFQF